MKPLLFGLLLSIFKHNVYALMCLNGIYNPSAKYHDPFTIIKGESCLATITSPDHLMFLMGATKTCDGTGSLTTCCNSEDFCSSNNLPIPLAHSSIKCMNGSNTSINLLFIPPSYYADDHAFCTLKLEQDTLIYGYNYGICPTDTYCCASNSTFCNDKSELHSVRSGNL
jgi:hypothetical protein